MLKDAIDWASRPAQDSPLRHKPIALMAGHAIDAVTLAPNSSILWIGEASFGTG